MTAVLVEVTRGPLVENRLRGSVAIVTSTGRPLLAAGDANLVTYWRSAAKPIQAMELVRSGAADRFGFGPEHLAIFASSHNGEPVHTEWVSDALARAGLGVDLLQCGIHAPFDRETAEATPEPGPLHNNCSGKHTAMLALAKHLGMPLATYLDPASPLQQRILATVAEAVGMAPGDIAIGVDGCGVPVFGLPVSRMAYAFARLADPATMSAGLQEPARRFREAMRTHPYLVAGRKRICTALMSLPGLPLVAKSGADGVYSVGILPEAVARSPVLRELGAQGGVGITIKMESGVTKERDLVVVGVLEYLGLLGDQQREALRWWRPGPVKNHAGRHVGEVRLTLDLQRV
jgi:L-asparaginase II